MGARVIFDIIFFRIVKARSRVAASVVKLENLNKLNALMEIPDGRAESSKSLILIGRSRSE